MLWSTLVVLYREEGLEVEERHDVERRRDALRFDPLTKAAAHAFDVGEQPLVSVRQLCAGREGKKKKKRKAGVRVPSMSNSFFSVSVLSLISWQHCKMAAMDDSRQ